MMIVGYLNLKNKVKTKKGKAAQQPVEIFYF